MTNSRLADCSILILAGGRGQRMGGQDKGLVEWNGEPLVAWPHRIARPLTDDLLVSCNRNQERYAAFADRLISDDDPGFQGPLAGIRTGLAAAYHSWLMVLPCDAPLVDEALLRELYATAQQAPGTPLMARRGAQWEPLFCMIPVGLTAAVEDAWQQGERSNLKALLRLHSRAFDLAIEDPRLANLNSPELLLQQAPPEGT